MLSADSLKIGSNTKLHNTFQYQHITKELPGNLFWSNVMDKENDAVITRLSFTLVHQLCQPPQHKNLVDYRAALRVIPFHVSQIFIKLSKCYAHYTHWIIWKLLYSKICLEDWGKFWNSYCCFMYKHNVYFTYWFSQSAYLVEKCHTLATSLTNFVKSNIHVHNRLGNLHY